MKRWFVPFVVLGFMMVFQVQALADEGHDDSDVDSSVESLEETNQISQHDDENTEESTSIGNADVHDDDTNRHNEEESHNEEDSHKEEDSHDEEGGGHSEQNDNHGNVQEQAALDDRPNYKVLGTFGAINLSFLLIGVWNKFLRRKGE